jgi:putative serine/threonine protein kinase
LDHGELSKAPKHLIVDETGKPWIVDFETASDIRKPANVAAACHYLFIGALGATVSKVLGERNRTEIINVLRLYKKARSPENFNRVQRICLG